MSNPSLNGKQALTLAKSSSYYREKASTYYLACDHPLNAKQAFTSVVRKQALTSVDLAVVIPRRVAAACLSLRTTCGWIRSDSGGRSLRCRSGCGLAAQAVFSWAKVIGGMVLYVVEWYADSNATTGDEPRSSPERRVTTQSYFRAGACSHPGSTTDLRF